MSHLPDSTTGADLLEDAPHPTLGNHSNAAGHIIPSGCRYRSTTCVVPMRYVVPKVLKRKLSIQEDQRPCKRRTGTKNPASATSALAVVSSMCFFARLPTELIIIVARFLCPRDLHMLTCVNRTIAMITCSLYFEKCNFAPQTSRYSVSVTGKAFSALPVWRRSPYFASKPILSCIFDGNSKALVDKQINHLKTMISFLPSKSAFDQIDLWGNTTPDCLWDLLEVIDRAGFRTVDVDSWHLHMPQHNVGPGRSVQLVALEILRLQYPNLSSSAWAVVLGRLFVPHLRKLDIVGDVSWSSLTEFLQRHPGLCEVHLCLPSGTSHLNLTHHPTLNLPALEAVSCPWDYLFALLRILPSPPHLRTLCIRPVTNLQYRAFMENVFGCLALCAGTMSLDIGFYPSKCQPRRVSPVSRRAISIRRLQSSYTIRARFSSLRLRVQNISDESILVCCDHWLQLLPDVPLVEVQKKRPSLDAMLTSRYFSWGKVHRNQTLKIEWHS